jgi:hypothetical protein
MYEYGTPNEPFGWQDTESLHVELSSFPALGGLLNTPPAPTNIPRSPTSQGSWRVRFLEHGKQDAEINWSSWLSLPAKGSTMTQDVEGTKGSNSNLKTLSLNNTLIETIGTYPNCYRMVETEAQIVTPDETGSLADIDRCGPFTLHWKDWQIPAPTQTLVGNLSSATPPVASVSVTIPGRVTQQNATVAYQWTIRSQSLNDLNPTWTDPALLPFSTASGTVTLNDPNMMYEVRVRTTVTPQANALIQCVSRMEDVVSFATNLMLLRAKGISQETTTNAADGVFGNVLCSPNPANDQTSLSYTLNADATVSIEIVDALQRVVMQPLRMEDREAGAYMLTVPTHSLATGAYTVRLTLHPRSGVPVRHVSSLLIHR